ncbi:pentapeptide repeat-containing protein [Streptomyces sp. NRRL S-1448]|uniref:pentapeptide repeat-containing protein n=1 Tax=Streptomyces sp. NRRL S-1448 TaxID=1463883 RepID=UPI0004BFCE31|nr:pentapeptide repeat-containing protein [Streptomyces sp. NRRL S-1448]
MPALSTNFDWNEPVAYKKKVREVRAVLAAVAALPIALFFVVMYVSLTEALVKGSKVAAWWLLVESLALAVTIFLFVWLRYRRDRQIGLLIGLLAIGAIWLWGPHLWDAVSSTVVPQYKGLKPAERAQAVGQYRLAVVQACAAAGGVIALLYTARNYRLIRRGQVTDRLSKALERLESTEEFVRLGGILALQQIIHDAPAQAEHVTHIVRTFIRRQAPQAGQGRSQDGQTAAASGLLLPTGHASSGPERPAADVQAALTALNTRHAKLYSSRIDLSGYHLAGAHMARQNLHGAQLSGAVLTNAFLDRAALGRASLENCDLRRVLATDSRCNQAQMRGADLREAVFILANMAACDLTDADLRHAELSKSDLQIATLVGGKLSGARLVSTDLTKADLTDVRAEEEPVCLDGSCLNQARLNGAVLRNASLIGAQLRHADLTEADLTGADLTRADLRRAQGLTADQLLAAASIDKAKLDPPLRAACEHRVQGTGPEAHGPVGQEVQL